MKIRLLQIVLSILAFGGGYTPLVYSAITVDVPFKEGMVLQRGKNIPISGLAAPGESVQVALDRQHWTTTASAQGVWQLTLPPLPAGGPYELVVSGGAAQIRLKDVLIGDVWVCGGQSNMSIRVRDTPLPPALANGPYSSNLRFYTVPFIETERLKTKNRGSWFHVSAESVKNFSAVCYVFGKTLQDKLNVPVGLINVSYPGTMISAWLPPNSITTLSKPLTPDRLAKKNKLARSAAYRKKSDASDISGEKNHDFAPSSLFSDMVAAITGFPATGVAWYQGEGDSRAPETYEASLESLITGWRDAWGDQKLAFLIVQLAGYGTLTDKVEEKSGWALIREAQLSVSQKLPDTGLVTTIDMGKENKHPDQKDIVGMRLANEALRLKYNVNGISAVPVFKSAEAEANAMRVNFTSEANEMTHDGKTLTGFSLAGSDYVWRAGQAAIDGNSIVVKSPEVQNPVAVRYAWAQRPNGNLKNKQGLPVSPFRSDKTAIAAATPQKNTQAAVITQEPPVKSSGFPGSGSASVGFNKYDLALQYMGKASGGDGSLPYLKVTKAMGRKAIFDARDANVSYLRISATGFDPSAYRKPGDLDLWLTNPAQYWSQFDELMTDLETAEMQGVFTLIWNPLQFPAMTGETVRDLITQPDSKSYQTAERYIREFVQRYKNRKAVLFYELTNELNLGADLGAEKRCNAKKQAALCDAKGHYTSAEMVEFTKRLSALIHGIDPSRPISSGFSVPRASAEHLRASPEWISGKADFRQDSLEQLQQNLAFIHEGVDIISVHIYPNEANVRFGAKDRHGVELLESIKKIADKIGKPLFVGEFGDRDDLTDSPASYTVRMLNRIRDLRVPYSALWVWEFYQKSPHITRDNQHTGYSLEPSDNNKLIQKISQTNNQLGQKQAKKLSTDSEPPRVVLTWPLDCGDLSKERSVHAVASDDSGAVNRVEFWLDGKKVDSDANFPYEMKLPAGGLNPGSHQLKAIAYDSVDKHSEWETALLSHPTHDQKKECLQSIKMN